MVNKIFTLILGVILPGVISFAQDNTSADNIIGTYNAIHQGEESKVRITRENGGTFMAQIIWVKNRTDENGNVRLDEKNPDTSLRHVPCDEIVIFTGLKYNPDKKQWDGTKIYDPTRGIRANLVCRFEDEGVLRVKGSLLGFSQSFYWKKTE